MRGRAEEERGEKAQKEVKNRILEENEVNGMQDLAIVFFLLRILL